MYIYRTNCSLICIPYVVFKSVLDHAEVNVSNPIKKDLDRVTKMKSFIKEVLQKTFLFQNMTEDQINFLAGMMENEYVFQKDQYIIHEGELSKSLFIIEKGSVRLERLSEDGSLIIIKQCGPGEVLGELSLVTGLPRTASVIANERSIVLELTAEIFEQLTDKFQGLRLKLAMLVEHRLKESSVSIQK